MTIRISEVTENELQVEFKNPNISLDRDSVYGMATFCFIREMSDLIALHCANNRYISYEQAEEEGFYFNDGSRFENDYLIMHSYDWSEAMGTEELDEDPNRDCFLDKKTGAAISWYKWAPRGLCVNEVFLNMLENDTVGEMLNRLHKTLNA